MLVKSLIARPGANAVLAAGSTCRVEGAAWTAGAAVTRVEVSADGGASWNEASLGKESAAHSWRLWAWDWKVPDEPGRCTLLARATDSGGRTQPMERDANLGTYMVNHCIPVELEIR